jgi:hypothetical protein
MQLARTSGIHALCDMSHECDDAGLSKMQWSTHIGFCLVQELYLHVLYRARQAGEYRGLETERGLSLLDDLDVVFLLRIRILSAR